MIVLNDCRLPDKMQRRKRPAALQRKLLHLALGLVALLPLVADVNAQSDPRIAARKLYAIVVKESLSGLPDQKQLNLIRPYLSRNLQLLFSKAQKKQENFTLKHPDDKPPLADGCLFSCSFEGPKSFSTNATRFSGKYAFVKISESDGSVSWVDTAVLVKENGRWVLWDVQMGCNWPFRMGPSLRAMLKSS